MAMSDARQAVSIFLIGLGVILLIIGLGNMFSGPNIDLEDPAGTANSIFDWFFDAGGGLVSAIIGLVLILAIVAPEVLSVVIGGKLE